MITYLQGSNNHIDSVVDVLIEAVHLRIKLEWH